MQAIMETVFEIPYLIGVVVIGILMLRMAGTNRQWWFFGAAAVLLGCGDAFHLVPRMWALWTDGTANHAAMLGVGKLVTSITMTVFYVLLYHFWQERYGQKSRKGLTVAVYALATVRIALCLFPQNQWLSGDAPLSWGIYRNIPFVAIGVLLMALFFRRAKEWQDAPFRLFWLAMALSFVCYIPVVLWADAVPLIGMLMLPKTCAYVWMVWMGSAQAKKEQRNKAPGIVK